MAALLAAFVQFTVSNWQHLPMSGLAKPQLPNAGPVSVIGPVSDRRDMSTVGARRSALDPAVALDRVAATILYGPALIADFRGLTNLEVALRPMKSVRGQSSVVAMSGTFSSLGLGTGLARWQVNMGSPPTATINFFCQPHDTVVYSTTLGAMQGSVSVQPDWLGPLDPMTAGSHGSETSLYGSPVSLIQWLPHHFECRWGEVQHLPLAAHRLEVEPEQRPSVPGQERFTIIGAVRPTVAAQFGIAVPTAYDLETNGESLDSFDWPLFASWARQVPVPLPHLVEIRLIQGVDGVVSLERTSFFRIHPLRSELEEMVGMEWGAWRHAPSLSREDVIVPAETP